MSGARLGIIGQVVEPPYGGRADSPRGGGAPGDKTLLQSLLRRKWAILVFALAATGAAAVVVVQLPVRYAATASIVVDPRQPRVISSDSLMSTQIPDPLLLRTRMEELRSPQIARAVVAQLRLDQVAEFCNPAPSLPARWLGRLGIALPGGEKASAARPSASGTCDPAAAAERLTRQVTGSADGRSFVIWVRAEASDPVLAAGIANAYATVFVERRRGEMQEIAQQARIWLTNNATELREKMQGAAAELEDYRAKHRLGNLKGETLATLSLAEANSQFMAASAELTSKRATLAELTRIAGSDGDIEASTTVQSLPSVQHLIEQYAMNAALYAQQRARLGPAHPSLVEFAQRLDRWRQLLRAEAGRAITALANEVRALDARRVALQDQVRVLQDQVSEQGQADVQLRDLEREANLTRDLYGTLLTRLTQIQAEQSLQVADVRLAVEAQVPDSPFAPKRQMILVGVFLAALGAGSVVALARDLLSRIFRDTEEIEEQTGLPVLGIFATPPRGVAPQDVVVQEAGSVEAEGVHGILASLTSRHIELSDMPGQIVLVTSSIPREGKSSFAVALGRAAAQAGLRSLVVDCDLRRPAIAKVAGLPQPAVKEAPDIGLGEEVPLFGKPVLDPRSKLHLLPLAGPIANPHEALAAARLSKVVAHLRNAFDVVILDTPPVLAAVDAINLARLADAVVLLVGWRKAPRAAVVSSLRLLHRNGARSTGIVLSKVNLRRYAREAGEAHLALPYRDERAAPRLEA